MAQLRRDYPKFSQRNAVVIAIGPEDAERFTFWWIEHRMPFIGIPDPKHKVANLYGQQVKVLKLGRMPALVVVDKQGRMRFKHLGQAMSDIPSNKQVLELLDELNREEEK